MPSPRAVLPFSALVGQEQMKRALLLNAVNPAIGGVLIRGQKGTAKSTAVRALAALLPEIEVIQGCVYGCDPADAQNWCFDCREQFPAGVEPTTAIRSMRVVELPVNASEDRVVGTIDVEAAITRGERRFDPGVLAAAHRNILYVDEVNLLDDHIIDVLLDAAAMGVNTVEREGISLTHPSRFILVGTMNPEEGELRPQLLDRFGLCIDVRGLGSVAERIEVMERESQRQPDTAAEEQRLRDIVVKARELLPLVTMPPPMRWLVALICIDAGAMGHRADIVVSRTAQTICAWREAEASVDHEIAEMERERPVDALQCTPEDVIAAAELALLHRRRDRPAESQGSPSVSEQARERLEEMQQQAQAQAEAGEAAVTEETEVQAGSDSESTPADSSAAQGERTGGGEEARATAQQQFDGDLFQVRSIRLPRDRKSRSTSGRRSQSRSSDRRGRYVRATQTEHTTDIALDATMRAAAPHQQHRRAEAPEVEQALHVERQDLRQKVRRRKTGTLIVFVVDASASMDAEQRMQATKGAVLSLLRDAYVRRDKVSLVVFSGRTARVALQPTSSVDLAESRLQRLAVGGTTPLTHGLVAGLKLVRNERLRDRSVYPLIVLISDGRGNISLFGDEPLIEAQRVAAQIGTENIRLLVIDSARDYTAANLPLPRIGIPRSPLFAGGYGFNACLDLAERAGGEYLGLYDLSQNAIVAGVERTLRGR